MINNKYMYDKELYKTVVDKLKSNYNTCGLTTEEYTLIESALRNQCIVIFTSDLDMPVSPHDVMLAYDIRQAIKKSGCDYDEE